MPSMRLRPAHLLLGYPSSGPPRSTGEFWRCMDKRAVLGYSGGDKDVIDPRQRLHALRSVFSKHGLWAAAAACHEQCPALLWLYWWVFVERKSFSFFLCVT